jgi:cytochrome c-type biogenesis protein CcmH/NrfG
MFALTGCFGGKSADQASLAHARKSYETGQFKQAEQELDKIVKNSPRNTEALKTLALALAAQGKNVEAIQAYQRLLDIAPKDDASWYRMAMLQQILGRPKQTAEALKKAIAIKPSDPTYTDSLARTYMSIGKYAEAADLWGQLLADREQKKSRQGEILVLQGQAFEAAQNYSSARKSYAAALKLSPDNNALRTKVKSLK